MVEPIVTKEVWNSCQYQSKRKARHYERTATYLFTNKLICSKCDCFLGGSATKKPNGTKYFYYKCEHCKEYFNENQIEDKLFDVLLYLQQENTLIEDYYTPFRKSKMEFKKEDYTKEVIEKLKTTITNKENVILKKADKEKLLSYIDKVDNTNNEYQNIQELLITLKDVDKELKDNKKQINTLKQNVKGLELRNKNLQSNLDSKDKELKEVKNENLSLKNMIISLKERFKNLLNFLSNRIFKSTNKDQYYEFSKDLYTHDVLTSSEINSLKDDYNYSKQRESKNNSDDFEL